MPMQKAPIRADTQQTIADSLRNISSRYDEQAERAKRTEQEEAPCGEGKHSNNTDLCAQWKAADFAADSAWWAWAAGIAGIVSTFGVVAALGIGIHSNWIARDAAKRQLRAYVAPIGFGMSWALGLKTGVTLCRIHANIVNSGQSPVRGLFMPIQYTTVLDPSEQFANIRRPEWHQTSPLGPQSNTATMPVEIPEDEVWAAFKGDAKIFIYGGLFYNDIFGDHHITRYCIQVTFEKTSDAERPDIFHWSYIGPHNCSDEECMIALRTVDTVNARS